MNSKLGFFERSLGFFFGVILIAAAFFLLHEAWSFMLMQLHPSDLWHEDPDVIGAAITGTFSFGLTGVLLTLAWTAICCAFKGE